MYRHKNIFISDLQRYFDINTYHLFRRKLSYLWTTLIKTVFAKFLYYNQSIVQLPRVYNIGILQTRPK